MGDKSDRLYYGAIDVTQLQTQPVAPSKQTRHRKSHDDVELSAAAKEQLAIKESFELQRAARTVAAPTSDADVKLRLRDFDEAICLFGEGPYERRERLRLLLARRAKGVAASFAPDVLRVESANRVEQRLFFTEGSEELLNARKWIARYSLPRSIKRLKRDRAIYTTVDPFEAEAKVHAYNQVLQNSIQVSVSQIGAERPLACGRYSPDGRLFATGSWCPEVKIWSLPNCELVSTMTGHEERVHGLCWSPLYQSNNDVKMQHEESNEDTREEMGSLEQRLDESLQLSKGIHLVTGGSDLKINCWNLTKPSAPVSTMTGHDERINKVEFHPSGRFVGSTSHDETWRLWDLELNKEVLLQEGHATGVYAINFHPDGSLVLTADLGGVIRGWDLRTGRTVTGLQGHVKQVLSISLNPKMPNQLATCSDDNTVKLWDLRKQRCFEQILAHDKLISDVVFEPQFGRYLLTSSYDSTLKVWDSVDWSCTKTLLGHEARVMAADISSNGRSIASVSFDRTIKIWALNQ